MAIGPVVVATPSHQHKDIVIEALHSARRRVVITTPYFVPDEALLTAMRVATEPDVAERVASRSGGAITPAIKVLIAINGAAFLLKNRDPFAASVTPNTLYHNHAGDPHGHRRHGRHGQADPGCGGEPVASRGGRGSGGRHRPGHRRLRFGFRRLPARTDGKRVLIGRKFYGLDFRHIR